MANEKSIEEQFTLLLGRINDLEKEVVRLRHIEDENQFLRKYISVLEERLSKYENPKNSSNSNMPPSSDFPKYSKTNTLRTPSGKSPGGQLGRKGNTLKMAGSPDVIKEHQSNYCTQCGKDISSLPCELIGKRQVIDIPPIEPIVAEHRIYKRICTCGHCNVSSFPYGINAPVSYGSGVQSLVAYLNARHYVPVARSAEFLNDIFKVSISTGGICYLLNKAKQKAIPAYESIRQFVLNQKIIGADETGVNVNGKNNWAWAFQNPKATFIAIHERRGAVAINDIMPEGLDQKILVTDCWPAYFKKEALSHQICTAHLQRELKYLNQCYPENSWVNRLAALIENALDLFKSDKLTQIKINEIHRTFSLLLEEPATTKDIKELITFQKRMVKYQDYVFGFLDNPSIPPDNNGSERAIRNFKVKLKNSGFFKSFEGATIYAVLRSIIDTALKNDQNPYLVMQLLAQNIYPTE
jgi:transposase